MTTSTSLASSFSFKPSTPELVFSSSVIAIPTGFFVRFVIRVDLNQSVSNASFVEQLQKGILEAYENGSADIALANVSVDVSEYKANYNYIVFIYPVLFLSIMT